MPWEYFHHPDICLPVIARRRLEEFLFMVYVMGIMALSRGWALVYNDVFTNKNGFRIAKSRLKKKGLIVQSTHPHSGLPIIRYMGKADTYEPLCRPEKYWKRKWNNRWYVLMYDVPEKERVYRDELRAFLKSMKMGNLQKSIWISPVDIRSAYADLAEEIQLDEVAVLLESRTVLGRSDRALVRRAWKTEDLCSWQRHFIDTCRAQVYKISTKQMSTTQVAHYFREHMRAYRSIMERDPLLPEALWPENYLGREVVQWHRHALEAVRERLEHET